MSKVIRLDDDIIAALGTEDSKELNKQIKGLIGSAGQNGKVTDISLVPAAELDCDKIAAKVIDGIDKLFAAQDKKLDELKEENDNLNMNLIEVGTDVANKVITATKNQSKSGYDPNSDIEFYTDSSQFQDVLIAEDEFFRIENNNLKDFDDFVTSYLLAPNRLSREKLIALISESGQIPRELKSKVIAHLIELKRREKVKPAETTTIDQAREAMENVENLPAKDDAEELIKVAAK